MQENVLKLILLAVEDGRELDYSDLLYYVVPKVPTQNPKSFESDVDSVIQLLRYASYFQVNIQQ